MDFCYGLERHTVYQNVISSYTKKKIPEFEFWINIEKHLRFTEQTSIFFNNSGGPDAINEIKYGYDGILSYQTFLLISTFIKAQLHTQLHNSQRRQQIKHAHATKTKPNTHSIKNN